MESRQILQFGTAWNGRSSPFHIFPAVFGPFLLVFHPFFMILVKTGKKWVPKNRGTGKERTRSFPVSFPFPFFPVPCLAHLYFLHGIKCTMRVALSTTVSMESFLPFVTSKSVMKSSDISDHFFSGIEVDCRTPRPNVWSVFSV